MSETIIVAGSDSTSTEAPAATEAPASTERALGRAEAEIEHLEENVEEAEAAAAAAASTAEVALSVAGTASETAWDARSELETFKAETRGAIAEILELIKDSDDEVADDILEDAPADSVEIVNDSPPIEEAPATPEAPKRPSMLRRLLYGRS